jgi:hypothetical protein
MKTKDKPTLDELIRSNSKVNPDLVASAIAAIKEIRENGFVDEGYRLSGRRNTITGKKANRACDARDALPRRHR